RAHDELELREPVQATKEVSPPTISGGCQMAFGGGVQRLNHVANRKLIEVDDPLRQRRQVEVSGVPAFPASAHVTCRSDHEDAKRVSLTRGAPVEWRQNEVPRVYRDGARSGHGYGSSVPSGLEVSSVAEAA